MESKRAYAVDLGQTTEVSNYLDVSRKIDTYLAPGATVVGAERWWWALRDHPYLASNNLWLQWRIAAQDSHQPLELGDWLAGVPVDFAVVSVGVRDDMRSYFAACGKLLAGWTDVTYGQIEVYRIEQTPSSSPACSP